jgi:cobalt transporter subunit CbtB
MCRQSAVILRAIFASSTMACRFAMEAISMDLVVLPSSSDVGDRRHDGVRVERSAMTMPALTTCLLGLAILFCVGFMNVPVVHNGAHDTRHADGFPCH